MNEHLDDLERARLAEAEQRISTGIDVIVRAGETLGRALWEIRDDRLYRGTHRTFERYARERWSLSSRHANRLIHFAQVTAVLGTNGPETESHARELAPLLDRPGVMRRAWASVVHRTGGKPTAKDVREAVHETIPKLPADGPAPAGPSGEGAPAATRGEARPAGDTHQTPSESTGTPSTARSPEGTPPATDRAGEGDGAPVGRGGGPVSGAPDAAGVPRAGAPTGPHPEPQPASPHDAGPESGGTAPSARSHVEGAALSSADPVVEETAWDEPILTGPEVHAALTDPACPLYLSGLGCRLALVHITGGARHDRAVVGAFRQTAGAA